MTEHPARLAVVAAAVAVVVGLAAGPSLVAPPPMELVAATVADPVVQFSDAADWAPSPPSATARSFLLVDADTGQELAARDADRDLPVASTVKLLTILAAVERVELDDVVTVGDEVAVGGAGVGLRPGDTWTVRQLVEAILVRSGNDAALALAAHAGGSVEGFVGMMRDTAEDLGLDVVLETPTGLDDRNRLSARDLAVLGRALLDVPELAEIADLETVELPGLGLVRTRNLLLESRPEVTGVKTGFTTIAGWCLVAAMETDDGRELLSVVLGAREDQDRFDESAALLDFGDDATAPLELTAGALVDVPGGAVGELVDVEVSVPAGGGAEVRSTWDGASVTTVVQADGPAIATATATVDVPPPSGSVGALLTARLYEVMRRAHAADLWPGAGG